jgi:NarL family two-component system response regulator LiaR
MKHPHSSPSSVGVMLIEPLNVPRAALRHFLDSVPDMHVIAEATSPREALRFLRGTSLEQGTVIVISLEPTTQAEALNLIRRVHHDFPSVSVLVTASRADHLTLSRALFVGADSFVPQDRDLATLVDAIRRTADGENVITASRRSLVKANHSRSGLTERELQVLAVAAEGMTSRQMARTLGIQERTVSTHLGHIYRKLGSSNRAAAVIAATRAGLLDSSPQDE